MNFIDTVSDDWLAVGRSLHDTAEIFLETSKREPLTPQSHRQAHGVFRCVSESLRVPQCVGGLRTFAQHCFGSILFGT